QRERPEKIRLRRREPAGFDLDGNQRRIAKAPKANADEESAESSEGREVSMGLCGVHGRDAILLQGQLASICNFKKIQDYSVELKIARGPKTEIGGASRDRTDE